MSDPTPPGAAPDIPALMQAAFAAHRAGQLAEAERAYRAVLAAQPQHADALHHLGLVRHQGGQSEEGLALIGAAIALDGANLQYRFNLASVLGALGREEEADAAYRDAARVGGGNADAYAGHAAGLLASGALAEAMHHARMARAAAPQRVETHVLLGRIYLARGRAEDALAAFGQALQLDDTLAEAHLALAELLQGRGRHREAAAHFGHVLRLEPGRTAAHFQLGNSLAALEHHAEAEAAYRKALEAHPHLPMLHSNLANVLIHLRRWREAEAACRRALELDPELPEAHANLATLAQEAWRLDEAEAGFRKAIALKPELAVFHGGLGNVLLWQCRPEEACAAFREGLRLAPHDRLMHSNLLFTLNYRDPLSREALYEAHAEFGRRCQQGVVPAARHENAAEPERPLRVGFVTSCLRQHPVAIFTEALFRHHDAAQMEVFCYSDAERPDAVTERIEALVEHWRVVYGRDDDEVAAQIGADGIDVLVDLNGHSGRNRLPLFARRLAPVQASYVGNMNTTGLADVDYWITDALLTPPELQPFYAETLWHLPRCMLAYTPPADAPEAAPPPAAAGGQVTFGSFNNAAKLSPRTVAVWSEVLRAVPGSRLLLRALQFGDPPTAQRAGALFAAQGIAPERIVLRAPTLGIADYLADFALVDIALDPFPYNGVTCTCDTLWMGVPVVALAGDTSYSRVGVSLLTHLGHPEWIAPDAAAYVEIARGLAAHPERLAALRASLREEMARSPLCDGPGFAHAMEGAFREMWRRWCAAQGQG